MSNPTRLAATFVVVVAVVVGVSAVAPAVFGGGAPEGVEPRNASTFQSDAILAEDLEESGEISVDAETSGKVVVVDTAHANSFSRSDIQPLVSALVENGHEVRFHGSGQQAGSGFGAPASTGTLNESLEGADALVVVSPGQRFAGGEINGVTNFSERGGRVLLLAEPESLSVSVGGGGLFGISIQQVQSQLTPLASQYGIDVGTSSLFNMEENANNFRYVYATPAADTTLTAGVDRVVLAQSTRLSVDESNATTTMTAIDGTRLESTRDGGTYAVAARNGNVTTVADATFLSPDFHQVADNEVLVGNVVEFLTTGEKTPKPEPDTSGPGGPLGPGTGPGPSPGPTPQPTPTPPSE